MALETKNKTTRRILEILKKKGPKDAQSLSRQLNVSSAAVRQHLYPLRESGLVESKDETRPLGRPAKVWRLTKSAGHLFPSAYSELTISLLKSTEEILGI